MAGLCAEADYIFVPEDPPKPDWPERLCEQLSQARILYPPSFPCINQTHTRARSRHAFLLAYYDLFFVLLFPCTRNLQKSLSVKIAIRYLFASSLLCSFARQFRSLARLRLQTEQERPKVCRFLRARDSFKLLSANQERIRDITFIRYQCVHFI